MICGLWNGGLGTIHCLATKFWKMAWGMGHSRGGSRQRPPPSPRHNAYLFTPVCTNNALVGPI